MPTPTMHLSYHRYHQHMNIEQIHHQILTKGKQDDVKKDQKYPPLRQDQIDQDQDQETEIKEVKMIQLKNQFSSSVLHYPSSLSCECHIPSHHAHIRIIIAITVCDLIPPVKNI